MNETFAVTGALHRIREGHRRVFAKKPPKPKPRRPLRAATALCRAYRLRERIASGEARDQAELAAALGFSRARVTQLMDLLLLAPDIQESLLHMEVEVGRRDPFAERDLRGIVRALDWGEQRALWAELEARHNPERT